MAERWGGHCSRLKDSTARDVPRTLAFRHPVLGAMERGGVEAEGGGKAGESLSAPPGAPEQQRARLSPPTPSSQDQQTRAS